MEKDRQIAGIKAEIGDLSSRIEIAINRAYSEGKSMGDYSSRGDLWVVAEDNQLRDELAVFAARVSRKHKRTPLAIMARVLHLLYKNGIDYVFDDHDGE